MKKHSLTAETRTLFGRKTRQLRKMGHIPATVYGKKLDSIAITIPADAFTSIYKEVGESGLIELTIGKTVHPVLVNNVQIHAVTRAVLHVEMHQVDLKEKIQAKIPVHFIGTSPAVEEKIGVLLTLLDEIEVEALPTDLPEFLELDVSVLKNINDSIDASSITLPHAVSLITSADSDLIRVAELVSHAAEEEAAKDAAAQAEAKVESAETVPPTDSAKPDEAKSEEPEK